MAIQFARARYISRSSGGSAVRSAAYNERTAITAERTGEVYYFKHRDAPAHHEVLLPEGADARFADSGVLWNAAETAERRKDAQVAREIVLALPSDADLTTDDRIALARSFAEQHFVAKGLAVQLDVHAPHDPGPQRARALGGDGESESERANWHAHLLITTRRLEGERFAAKKARDLDPEVRHAGGRAVVADGEAWGVLWRDHQNRYFQEHGLDLRVDPVATHPGQHLGPVRMRRAGAEIVERAEALRQANEAAARDPDQVLATLTRRTATFTERDVDRHLAKHLTDETERTAVKAAVMTRPDVVALHDRVSGEFVERFTTRAVRDQERAALADAADLAHARSTTLSLRAVRAALADRTLSDDQRGAFDHAVAPGQLKLIEGRAGTGKSFTLGAIRDAHTCDGRRVIGLAPTNAVAQDLRTDGFAEAGTVHAELFRLKNGRTHWDAKTVVIVDEAAMLDARITGELLGAARSSGAKLILAGDDRQLASIERGGLFAELTQRHSAAEISAVVRQRADWQRQAARDLAEGRFADAINAFDQAGAITWTQDQVGARGALTAAWSRDIAADPRATRFVFAYTNDDVDALNADLRAVRRARSELAGPDVPFETKHGLAAFAVGDRVQFTDTDKRARIYNGNVGTIINIEESVGRVTTRLDSGRDVSWVAAEFQGFRHGYAGTIYKGQGKTLDHTYLYHTHHWRSAASYVALTRQRESAQVFVARETARDTTQLAWQMARFEMKAASVAWATMDELTPEQLRLQQRAGTERHAPQPDLSKHPEPASMRSLQGLRERLAGARARGDDPLAEARRDVALDRLRRAVREPGVDPLADARANAARSRNTRHIVRGSLEEGVAQFQQTYGEVLRYRERFGRALPEQERVLSTAWQTLDRQLPRAAEVLAEAMAAGRIGSRDHVWLDGLREAATERQAAHGRADRYEQTQAALRREVQALSRDWIGSGEQRQTRRTLAARQWQLAQTAAQDSSLMQVLTKQAPALARQTQRLAARSEAERTAEVERVMERQSQRLSRSLGRGMGLGR